MAKKMQNLPEGMIPDRDNVVYYDTEKGQFYIIKWDINYIFLTRTAFIPLAPFSNS
jgi:spore coat protein CotH